MKRKVLSGCFGVVALSCTDPDNSPKPIKLSSDQELKLLPSPSKWKKGM